MLPATFLVELDFSFLLQKLVLSHQPLLKTHYSVWNKVLLRESRLETITACIFLYFQVQLGYEWSLFFLI